MSSRGRIARASLFCTDRMSVVHPQAYRDPTIATAAELTAPYGYANAVGLSPSSD